MKQHKKGTCVLRRMQDKECKEINCLSLQEYNAATYLALRVHLEKSVAIIDYSENLEVFQSSFLHYFSTSMWPESFVTLQDFLSLKGQNPILNQ